MHIKPVMKHLLKLTLLNEKNMKTEKLTTELNLHKGRTIAVRSLLNCETDDRSSKK